MRVALIAADGDVVRITYEGGQSVEWNRAEALDYLEKLAFALGFGLVSRRDPTAASRRRA